MPLSFSNRIIKTSLLTALVAPNQSMVRSLTPNKVTPRQSKMTIPKPNIETSQHISHKPYHATHLESMKPYSITDDHGSILEVSSFFEDHAKGRLVELDTTITEGDFIKTKDGIYVPDGIATRTFPDGTQESGTFKNGKFMSGIVRHITESIEIGSRLNKQLDGDLCIRLRSTGLIEIGQFTKNEFIHGFSFGGDSTTPFNPYEIQPLLSQNHLASLPLESRTKNGDTLTGIFVGDHMVYGKKASVNEDIYEGFFNSNGDLHGLGRHQFPNSNIVENGLYENGKFESGRVDYGNGNHQIGNRQNTKIHGDNCTHYFNKIKLIGTFNEGEKIYTQRVYSPTFSTPHTPYIVPIHTSTIDSGVQNYFINDLLVWSGVTFPFLGCNDVLNEHQAPLSFDPEKIETFMTLTSTLDTLAIKTFNRLFKSIKTHKNQGDFLDVVTSLGLDKLNIKTNIKNSQYNLKNTTVSLISHKTSLTRLLAVKIIEEFGVDRCKQMCLTNFKDIILEAESVFTGVRTFSRRETTLLDYNDKLLEPLFILFLNKIKKEIAKQLPHIEIVTALNYHYNSPTLEFDSVVYVANKDQYSALSNAIYPDQHATIKDMFTYNLNDFTGLGFRISKDAIAAFKGTAPTIDIFKDIFYRIGDVPVDVKERIDHWKNCAQTFYSWSAISNHPFRDRGIIQDSFNNLVKLTSINSKDIFGNITQPNGDNFVGKLTYHNDDNMYQLTNFGTHTQPNGDITVGTLTSNSNSEIHKHFRITRLFSEGTIQIGFRRGPNFENGININDNGKISFRYKNKWVDINAKNKQLIFTPEFLDELDQLPKDTRVINGVTYEGTFLGTHMIYGEMTDQNGNIKKGFFDKNHRIFLTPNPTVLDSDINIYGSGQITQN